METENPTDLVIVPKNDYYLLIVAQNPYNQNVSTFPARNIRMRFFPFPLRVFSQLFHTFFQIRSQLYKFIPEYGVFKIHPISTRGYGKLLSYENFDSGEIYVLVINRRSKTDVFKLIDGIYSHVFIEHLR